MKTENGGKRRAETKTVGIDKIAIGAGRPLALIAGPCVIEDERMTRRIAAFLKKLTGRLNIPFIFKASYDKANRTSLQGYRGPGSARGLEILAGIRADYGLPVLSDVHRFEEIDAAAAVLDVVQIPAFLCRQTDFVMAAARKSRALNIKKGQFLAPWDMKNVIEKAEAAGRKFVDHGTRHFLWLQQPGGRYEIAAHLEEFRLSRDLRCHPQRPVAGRNGDLLRRAAGNDSFFGPGRRGRRRGWNILRGSSGAGSGPL